MADTTYPVISTKAWYALRSKAVSSPKVVFTPDGVAALLELASGQSATNNVLGPLRKMGILDDAGALTERGKKWRSDDTYGEVCDELIEQFFPPDLAMLTDDSGQPDDTKIFGWFKGKFGTSSARGMANTYKLLASRSPSPPTPVKPKSVGAAPAKKATSKSEKVKQQPPKLRDDPPPAQDGKPPPAQEERRPDLHIDVQVHIAADASPEQIDQIFASMAKHLYHKP